MKIRHKKLRAGTIAAAICLVLVLSTGCTKNADNPADVTGTQVFTNAPAAEVTAALTEEPEISSAAEVTATPTEEPEISPAASDPQKADPEIIEIYVDPEWCNEWSEDEEVSYGYYEYDLPYLNEGYEEKYPELAKSFEKFADDRKAEEPDRLNEIVECAKADNNYGEYYIRNKLLPVRTDSSLVCLRCESTSLVGCEWGEKTSSYCFDPNSGKELFIRDLVVDRYAFIEYVYDHVVEKAESLSGSDSLRKYIEDSFDKDALSFEVGYDHLAVLFGLYELDGIFDSVTVTIPFKGNENLFDERCTTAARNYAIPVSGSYLLRTNLDSDGLVDELELRKNSDPNVNYNDFETVSVYVNGYSGILLECPCSCYDLNAAYIHVNGKDFIHVTYWYDSADSETLVYRIDTPASGYKPGAGQNPYADVVEVGEGWDIYGKCSYDPMNIELSARVDIIGTSFVKNRFYIDENGMSHPKGDVYEFLNKWVLTAKKSFDVKCISKETGEEKGIITVLYEEPLILYSTDRTMYIDFLTETDDSVVYRLMIECEMHDYGDWIYREYRPAGEESFDELFMGIGYAD